MIRAPQDVEDGELLGALDRRARSPVAPAAARRLRVERLEHGWMHVGAARDGRRVVEELRGRADRRADGIGRAAAVLGRLCRSEGTVGEDGRVPRPEVLGAELVGTRSLAQVRVHVFR